jgi:hypothetical protein
MISDIAAVILSLLMSAEIGSEAKQHNTLITRPLLYTRKA